VSAALGTPAARVLGGAMRRLLGGIALVALAASAAGAQVGYDPARSPYRDLQHSHEITGFLGWFLAKKDPAGVAPQSAPMVGARYEYRVGGPAFLYGRVAGVLSERTVLDPAQPRAKRDLGTRSDPFLMADAGLALGLTGARTWHSLLPVVSGGVGIATDFKSADVGGYRFGTPFVLTLGGGVRIIPGSQRLQARLDLTDHLYRISYPDRFYRSGVDGTAILGLDVARSRWTHNLGVTLGGSYLLGR
jgi:hypothetical protein